MSLPDRRRRTVLQERIGGTPAEVAAALERLRAAGRAQRIDDVRLDDIVIVAAEVLNNIVEHAFAGRVEGHVDLCVTRRRNRVEVEIRDNGRPMPPDLLNGAEIPESGGPVEDLPEGGFGWFIIHSLVDDMIYERENGLNQMGFTFDVGPPPPEVDGTTGGSRIEAA